MSDNKILQNLKQYFIDFNYKIKDGHNFDYYECMDNALKVLNHCPDLNESIEIARRIRYIDNLSIRIEGLINANYDYWKNIQVKKHKWIQTPMDYKSHTNVSNMIGNEPSIITIATSYIDMIFSLYKNGNVYECELDEKVPYEMILSLDDSSIAICEFDKEDPICIVDYDLKTDSFAVAFANNTIPVSREGNVISLFKPSSIEKIQNNEDLDGSDLFCHISWGFLKNGSPLFVSKFLINPRLAEFENWYFICLLSAALPLVYYRAIKSNNSPEDEDTLNDKQFSA